MKWIGLRIRVAYMAYRRLMLHAYYLFENLVFVRTLKQCHGDLYRRRARARTRERCSLAGQPRNRKRAGRHRARD